ncbi:MAG: nucleotidyltransferase domain-containing protein, partial [Nanoarchaeota archaeon]
KKFWLIQEIAMFQDNFKLKKGAFIKDMIKGTIQVILEDKLSKDVKEIILFGSAVMKTLTLQSDIDIAVKFNKISLKEATLFRIRVQGKLNDKIDIQVFEYLPNRIKQEIKTYGKILYKI